MWNKTKRTKQLIFCLFVSQSEATIMPKSISNGNKNEMFRSRITKRWHHYSCMINYFRWKSHPQKVEYCILYIVEQKWVDYHVAESRLCFIYVPKFGSGMWCSIQICSTYKYSTHSTNNFCPLLLWYYRN
jgi:hypothetical protein